MLSVRSETARLTNNISMKKKLVLKIGTSTLTNGTRLISRGKIEDIGRQILALRDEFDIVLVSSGAIAAAKQYINIKDAGKPIESKQAMAAIGQPLLMRTYNEVLGDLGIPTAQCLMTYRDFENETSRQNTLNTIEELLKYHPDAVTTSLLDNSFIFDFLDSTP